MEIDYSPKRIDSAIAKALYASHLQIEHEYSKVLLVGDYPAYKVKYTFY